MLPQKSPDTNPQGLVSINLSKDAPKNPPKVTAAPHSRAIRHPQDQKNPTLS